MNNSFIFAGALAAVFVIAAMTSGMVSQINAQILPSTGNATSAAGNATSAAGNTTSAAGNTTSAAGLET